jgi:hypothetical protein
VPGSPVGRGLVFALARAAPRALIAPIALCHGWCSGNCLEARLLWTHIAIDEDEGADGDDDDEDEDEDDADYEDEDDADDEDEADADDEYEDEYACICFAGSHLSE